MSRIKFSKISAVLSVLVLLLSLTVIYLVVHHSVTKEGEKKQQNIVAAWNESNRQFRLCVNDAQSVVGEINTIGTVEDVLEEAIGGNYTRGLYGKPDSNNELFKAIASEYQGSKSFLLKKFAHMQEELQRCREDNKYPKRLLQEAIKDFKRWKHGFITSSFGGDSYPNKELAIEAQSIPLCGKLALAWMDGTWLTVKYDKDDEDDESCQRPEER